MLYLSILSERYVIFWLHPEKYDNFESYSYKIDLAQGTIINFIYLIIIDPDHCVYFQ